VKDARLRLIETAIREYARNFHERNSTLNRLEKAIYVRSLKLGVKELCPKDEAAAVLAAYDEDEAKARAQTEAARIARLAKKTEGPALTTPAGASISSSDAKLCS
jgi:IMP cyclohydrolase